MNNKDIFIDYMFEQFWGSDTDEYGNKNREEYKFECDSILEEIKENLNSYEILFGDITIQDVEKVVALEFYRCLGAYDDIYTYDAIHNVGQKYFELFL